MSTTNYEYLAELTIDPNSKLYNLYITTYNGNNVNLNIFICEKQHEMRLDLVSNDIYGSTRYVGTLCQLNNILNPFSIREGDVLFFTTQEEAEGLLVVPELIKQSGIEELLSSVKSDLIKSLKKKKSDPNKTKFNIKRNNEDILPPTVLPNNSPATVVENNKIRIAPNLFQNPKNDPISVDPIVTSVSNVVPDQQQNDTTERVLVNRYIKLINS